MDTCELRAASQSQLSEEWANPSIRTRDSGRKRLRVFRPGPGVVGRRERRSRFRGRDLRTIRPPVSCQAPGGLQVMGGLRDREGGGRGVSDPEGATIFRLRSGDRKVPSSERTGRSPCAKPVANGSLGIGAFSDRVLASRLPSVMRASQKSPIKISETRHSRAHRRARRRTRDSWGGQERDSPFRCRSSMIRRANSSREEIRRTRR
jgi:hypothetical protein